jgi:hypothetical protein
MIPKWEKRVRVTTVNSWSNVVHTLNDSKVGEESASNNGEQLV